MILSSGIRLKFSEDISQHEYLPMGYLYKQTHPNVDDVANSYKRKLVRTRLTTLFFILSTISILVVFLVKNKEYQNIITEDIEQILELEEELDICQDAKDEFKSKLDMITKLQSIFITDIEVGNFYEGGEVETDYGQKIYSSNTMYLGPRLKYYSLNEMSLKFLVKLYRPDGYVSTGTSSESVPNGYSYACTRKVYEGENERTLSNWGNASKGNWSSGKYRYEIWIDGKCLKTKEFTIY